MGTLRPLMVMKGMSVPPFGMTRGRRQWIVARPEPVGKGLPERGVGVGETVVLAVAAGRGRREPEQHVAMCTYPPPAQPRCELVLGAGQGFGAAAATRGDANERDEAVRDGRSGRCDDSRSGPRNSRTCPPRVSTEACGRRRCGVRRLSAGRTFAPAHRGPGPRAGRPGWRASAQKARACRETTGRPSTPGGLSDRRHPAPRATSPSATRVRVRSARFLYRQS